MNTWPNLRPLNCLLKRNSLTNIPIKTPFSAPRLHHQHYNAAKSQCRTYRTAVGPVGVYRGFVVSNRKTNRVGNFKNNHKYYPYAGRCIAAASGGIVIAYDIPYQYQHTYVFIVRGDVDSNMVKTCIVHTYYPMIHCGGTYKSKVGCCRVLVTWQC